VITLKKKNILSALILLLILPIPVLASANLVGEWKFDECSGNITYDSSGYSNDGTRYNFTDGWVTGKYGCGLEFDGIDDYVNIPESSSLRFGFGNFTVEAWVKLSEVQPKTFAFIISQHDPEWLRYFHLSPAYEGEVWFAVSNDSLESQEVVSTTQVFDNQWHYIVGVREGINETHVNHKIYVDGNLENEDTFLNMNATNPDIPFTIGSEIGQEYWTNGTIDNVRIWDGALADEEIENLYLYNSLEAPEEPLDITGFFGYTILSSLTPLFIAIVGLSIAIRELFVAEELTLGKIITVGIIVVVVIVFVGLAITLL